MTKDFIDYRILPAETQIVKAIAIMAMLVHHLFLEHPEYGDAIYRLAIAGKACVALFVFLSGYGMATTFPKQKNSCINPIKTFFFFLGKRYIILSELLVRIFYYGSNRSFPFWENIRSCLWN